MMRGNSLLSSAPRMSLSALNTLDDQERQVRIWLLGSTEVKGTVFYRIAGRFTASGQTWQVNRRYSEFLVLRDTLVKYFSRTTDTCPGCLNYLHAIKQFDFPKKHLFVSRSQLVVNYRIQALRSFMNLLASWAFSNSPKCPTCGGFAFDIVRNFCLEGAEAMGDSNMSYIRDSFVVSTFTDAGRRSSLSRRNSFIPASGSQTLNAQRDQQHRRSDTQHRNTVAGGGRPSQPYRQLSHGDDYERDGGGGGSSRGSRSQQPRQPAQRASSSTGSGRTPQQSTTGNAQASSITGSFLFYQDGVEPGHPAADSQRPSTANGTSANGSQRGGAGAPPSTGSRRGILKNWNDVRQDRAQNNSYLSLGGDSAASLDPSDGDYKAPSSGRGQKKNRNDARSDNDSYFSLGASSGHSRDEDEYARASSKRAQKPSNGHTTREQERQRQQHLQQQQYQQQQQRDMRNNDRSLNDSYLSLGASSTSGDLEDEYHSHHPSVLPSPSNHDAMYVQPPPTQQYVGGTSKKPRSPPPSASSQRQSQRARSPPPSSQRQSHSQRTRSPPPSSQRKSQRHRSPPPPQYHHDDDDEEEEQPRSSRRHHQPQQQQQQQPQKQKQVQPRKQPPPPVDESFATDSFVDESLRFDGMGPIAVDDLSDSDDDEIDVTGLAIDARAPPRKSTSGQDLWQPWELAKAG